jgi:anti-sigma-K factor RskA
MSLSREDQALAGEFVLGLADPVERRRLERRIERDPEFAAAVQAWQRHFAGLDATAIPVTPSPDLWTRIEASRQAQGRARPAEPSRSRWADLWNSLALWRPAGLAGTLAALVLGVALLLRMAAGPETPQLVAVLAAPDGRAAAVVNAYVNGTVQLIPSRYRKGAYSRCGPCRRESRVRFRWRGWIAPARSSSISRDSRPPRSGICSRLRWNRRAARRPASRQARC